MTATNVCPTKILMSKTHTFCCLKSHTGLEGVGTCGNHWMPDKKCMFHAPDCSTKPWKSELWLLKVSEIYDFMVITHSKLFST